jgi:DNA repair photolyase
MERHEPEAFETEIYAKDWDPAAFARELRVVRPGHVIGLGTATDPYQPAEPKYGRTRQVLESLLGISGTSLFVTTKSDLVPRDADLLRKLAEVNRVRVSITITTLDSALARQLEPFAPRPDLRLKAVSKLASAGVPTGVLGSPVLPLLTDSEENLLSVAKAARDAGGSYFSAGVLFLKPEAQRVFFPFLQQEYPEYLSRYRKAYQDTPFLRHAYTNAITRRVEKVRCAAGLSVRDPVFEQNRVIELAPAQLHLF